jgi:hypothetical protein
MQLASLAQKRIYDSEQMRKAYQASNGLGARPIGGNMVSEPALSGPAPPSTVCQYDRSVMNIPNHS